MNSIISETTMNQNNNMRPNAWYQTVRHQSDFVHDTAHIAVIDALDALWQQLVEFKSMRRHFLGRSLLKPNVPQGLYLWGGVGRGKTFLMDAFYACLPYRRKRRMHFHNFMTEIHHEMKVLTGAADPLIALADDIEKSTRVLCLDEFHVDDIADAMILSRLLAALFERGVIVITTSNFPPDKLYLNGLQRTNFLPAIDLIKHHLKVIDVGIGNDYRLRTTTIREPLFLVANNTDNDAANEAHMAKLFKTIARESQCEELSIEILGRHIPVKNVASNVVWFDFKELCGGMHSEPDYLEIAHLFPTMFVSCIPQLTADLAAEARRFTWLIDVLYDNHVRLVVSAMVAIEDVYPHDLSSSEADRTVSRLTEMQATHYLKQQHHSQRVTLHEEA